MRKDYKTPEIDIIEVRIETILQAASVLDSSELQETEVDEGWSRILHSDFFLQDE